MKLSRLRTKEVGRSQSPRILDHLVYKLYGLALEETSTAEKTMIRHKNYENMNWGELVTEGKKRGLDQRLFSIKGTEGAGERDRMEITHQLNLLDQQKVSRDAKLIALISLAISAISLIVSLANNVFAQ